MLQFLRYTQHQNPLKEMAKGEPGKWQYWLLIKLFMGIKNWPVKKNSYDLLKRTSGSASSRSHQSEGTTILCRLLRLLDLLSQNEQEGEPERQIYVGKHKRQFKNKEENHDDGTNTTYKKRGVRGRRRSNYVWDVDWTFPSVVV